MPTARRQIMVQPPADRMTGGIGRSDIIGLQNAYPGSPVYEGCGYVYGSQAQA